MGACVAEGGDGPGESGWTNGPEFVLRAGLVFTLGALEQFERDVLKLLLMFRQRGSRASPSRRLYSPQQPTLEKEPPLWAYLEKPAQNQVERERIFKSVFGLDVYPLRKELEAFYEARNDIAHGRTPTLIKLSMFALYGGGLCVHAAPCYEAETKQRVSI